MRLINEFTKRGLYVGSVVVTQYNRQKAVDLFKARLKRRKIDVYFHYYIEGYPTDTKKLFLILDLEKMIMLKRRVH